MPRANRYIAKGRKYHLTHRCHDRRFLLKFATGRDIYRAMLSRRVSRHGVSLLGYCITSHPTHLLLTAKSKEQISRLVGVAADVRRPAYRLDAFYGVKKRL